MSDDRTNREQLDDLVGLFKGTKKIDRWRIVPVNDPPPTPPPVAPAGGDNDDDVRVNVDVNVRRR